MRNHPSLCLASKLERLPVRKLIELQHRLNGIFVKRRDAGGHTATIYGQLQIVERRLSAVGVHW